MESSAMESTKIELYESDALSKMNHFIQEDRKFDLIHSDLPFNTGRKQSGAVSVYDDSYQSSEMFREWLRPHVEAMSKLLTPNGVLALQLDDREHFSLRSICEDVFGPSRYCGTIIWSYETGGKKRNYWWSYKHQYIVLYKSLTCEAFFPLFNSTAVPTIERRSPAKKVKNAAGAEVVYQGDKQMSSVWSINWSTTHPDRTGYPSQKPIEIAKNLISVHTPENGWVLDPFCGSGTTGHAAQQLGRNAVLIDQNSDAIKVAKRRLHA